MIQKSIPDIVIARLPRYLQVLQQMEKERFITTSSQELSKKLGFSAAQIRKDLSQFGEFGKQGTGYSIPFLIEKLKGILKVDRTWNIALIGAGNLGKAIANYQGFHDRGFRIVAVLDNDPQKIGGKVGDFIVRDISQAFRLIPQMDIRVAMLTIPAESAQVVADILIEAGILAILNYAPIPLRIPRNIQIQYLDPLIQLSHMSYYL